ncbi:Clp protease N-terminal domain-containing protein [Nonomuraea sp. NPDC050556]|uniref:Clp protease N-terminal domain-containing protein n=1 Tax=Nonomuraea sp. NPDC050556 TaxID=3364369 RepID=UPI003799DC12
MRPFAKVIKAAQEEARRRGDRRISTEHLLLGLLTDEQVAEALGTDLPAARAALDGLDNDALAAIGLDTTGFEPVAAKHPAVSISRLSTGARAAVDRCVKATSVRTRSWAPAYLLMELLKAEQPDPVAALLAKLDVDRAAVRARLLDG